MILHIAAAALAGGVVEEMSFAELEASTSMKIVLFRDDEPASDETLQLIEMLSEEYGEYKFNKCSVTLDANKAEVEAAGFKDFPLVYTHTPEGSIQKFPGFLSAQSFKEWHDFRTNDILDDKVQCFVRHKPF